MPIPKFIVRIIEEWRNFTRKNWSFVEVGRHWDSVEDYDEINQETDSYYRRFTDSFLLTEFPDNNLALDFCSRTGNGTLYYFQRGKLAQAVCMDVSFNMGEICQRRLKQAGMRDFLWIPVSDYFFPLKDNVFDLILCFETLEHFAEPIKIIKELSRVTKPGGKLVFTTPNVLWEPVHALAAILGLHHSEGPHRFIPFRSLKRMLTLEGLKIEIVETTVLIPAGPRWLLNLGAFIERKTRNWLMPLVGLRRIVICSK